MSLATNSRMPMEKAQMSNGASAWEALDDVSDLAPYVKSLAAQHREFANQKRWLLQSAGFSPGGTLVDVGCGSGQDLPMLHRLAGDDGHVIGADLSFAMLGAIDLSAPRISLLQCTAGSLPLRSQSVDGVHAERLLLHAQKPSTFIEEFERVLAPGGVLFLREPNYLEQSVLDAPNAIQEVASMTRGRFAMLMRNPAIGSELAPLVRATGRMSYVHCVVQEHEVSGPAAYIALLTWLRMLRRVAPGDQVLAEMTRTIVREYRNAGSRDLRLVRLIDKHYTIIARVEQGKPVR
jgi:SAM-dependent methyltransferase